MMRRRKLKPGELAMLFVILAITIEIGLWIITAAVKVG